MREHPLERLNYFSGQRLEPGDLRLEQQYHILVQQWLMRSLFTPGVARGLDVSVEERKGKTPDNKEIDISVAVVHPGLALDALGRAIILAEPRELRVEGEFLTVRYDERKVAPQTDGCALPSHAKGAQAHARWGGPSRILSEPVFAWRDRIPPDDTLELVIAQFELDEFCVVSRTLTGPRRYATASPVARIHSFALEGEKDIDARNSKTIYFHIRGRRPEAVTLYLRAAQFSTLYYTELGQHDHGQSYSVGPPDKIDAHSHAIEVRDQLTHNDGKHPHRRLDCLVSRVPAPPIPLFDQSKSGFRMLMAVEEAVYKPITDANFPAFASPEDIGPLTRLTVHDDGSDHQHKFDLVDRTKTNLAPDNTSAPSHTHTVTPTVTSIPGAVPAPAPDGAKARTGPQLVHLKNLQISIDGENVTEAVKAQAAAFAATDANRIKWQAALGDGTDTHPLAKGGTGPIRLEFLSSKIDFREGTDHIIELSVTGDGNGGRILYNLYVE